MLQTTVHRRLLFTLGSLAIGVTASASAEPTVWRGGVVAADHVMASQAGLEMLEKGGNAVDAAVAAGFCLSVVRPMSCGIGGGGFMVVSLPDDPHTPGVDPVRIAINFREQAPAAVGPDFFEKMDDPSASRRSGAAVATPGFVAGLLEALDRYGTLDRETVMAPAIREAEQGFAVDPFYLEEAESLQRTFKEHPELQERHRFLWRRFLGEGSLAVGDVIKLPEQAQALRLIASQGASAFYAGPIGEAVIEAVRSAGGVMTSSDLASYEVSVTPPLVGSFHGGTLLMMPPPSSGGVATLQMLGMIEAYERLHDLHIESLGWNTPAYAHLLIETMKHAFADRARWLGDPAKADVPVQKLLDSKYLAKLAATIDPDHTLELQKYGTAEAPPDDHGTSHFSVVDKDGGAVACTQTINLAFGSWIGVDRFGFMLNNEMDDFTTRRGKANAFGLRQSDLNLPAPGKRPLSSMSPTIVLDPKGRVELVAGASGGPRIITGTLQAMLNTLLFDFSADRAVSAPRFHHQWRPNVIFLEPKWDVGGEAPSSILALQQMMDRVSRIQAFRSGLESRGHHFSRTSSIGVVQLIRRDGDGYQAASDPRKGGAPAGR